MKYLILFALLVLQSSYSQITKYSYSSSIESERDKLDAGKSHENKDSYKKSAVIFIIDDAKKSITISRKYQPKSGEAIDEFENYYFVKKVKDEYGEAYFYYAVDLVNKKYIEFIIDTTGAVILEDCDGFNGCRKTTNFKK